MRGRRSSCHQRRLLLSRAEGKRPGHRLPAASIPRTQASLPGRWFALACPRPPPDRVSSVLPGAGSARRRARSARSCQRSQAPLFGPRTLPRVPCRPAASWSPAREKSALNAAFALALRSLVAPPAAAGVADPASSGVPGARPPASAGRSLPTSSSGVGEVSLRALGLWGPNSVSGARRA